MNTAIIKNSALKIEILPEYGALISDITMGDLHLLQMDEKFLGIRNARAGGVPILFPFAGKTEGDSYILYGKEYKMPMHGFVKDAVFAIELLEEERCKLTFKGSAKLKEFYYPFDFKFEVLYELQGNTLKTSAYVNNLSEKVMPCSLGFHPYFYTSNKENLKLDFGLREYWDYINNGAHGVMIDTPKLSEKLNHVFRGNAPQKMVLYNSADGYISILTTDDSFEVTTLCTEFPEACCIEPWQGPPNCANSQIGVQFIEPGACRVFTYSLEFLKFT